MEFFAFERHHDGYGPIRIADGMADSDSLGKAVQVRRLPGVPQYVSARERAAAAATRPAFTVTTTTNLPDVEIDRLIKSAKGPARPLELGLTRTLPAKRAERGDSVFDFGSSDGFTLAPATKPDAPQGRAPMQFAGAASSGRIIGLGTAVRYPRYAYDEVSVPYWLLLLAPLSPLLLVSMLSLRRRHVRRSRESTGHCVACGYDLRETIGVCPECGHAKGRFEMPS